MKNEENSRGQRSELKDGRRLYEKHYADRQKNIHNNKLQVINQYEATGNYDNRYDVTILVNGLPLVHIELKRRGVAIKEAFNQIDRYQRDSFGLPADFTNTCKFS